MVVFREQGDKGKVGVLDAFCPHMGKVTVMRRPCSTCSMVVYVIFGFLLSPVPVSVSSRLAV